MKKIIKLTEQDLKKIVQKVLREDAEALPEMENVPLKKVEAVQQALIDAGYNIGPTGVDGKFGKNTRLAVIKFQRDNGIKQTGNVGPVTAGKLGVAPLTSGKKSTQTKTKSFDYGSNANIAARDNTYVAKKPIQSVQLPSGSGSNVAKKPIPSGSGSNSESLKGVSDQVKRQIDYMKKNNFLSDEKFTILDDKNNRVHAFEPQYSLFKTFYVITGSDRGDELNSQSLVSWALSPSNWGKISQLFGSNSKKSVTDQIKSCYLGSFKKHNTPSGVFRRAGNIQSFFNDEFLTFFYDTTYGKKYITWETCDGSTIPLGFHGTKSADRLKVLDAKNIVKQNCSKRDMSYGCINFKDADIKTINNFIENGQLTIWLPDTSNDIVEIPSNCINNSSITRVWNRI